MAELNVSKKSITALLGNMQNRLFVIPEYQRPYQWTTEHCDVLWEDIKYFSENSKEREYFLGTLVYAKNNENLDVIDGQQRFSFFYCSEVYISNWKRLCCTNLAYKVYSVL